MSLLFWKNWRGRSSDEMPPSARVLVVRDRKEPSRIQCRLLVYREESRSEHHAAITLSYVALDGARGGFNNHRFMGRWDWSPDGSGRVSITGGSVMVNGEGIPRGAHIGTYLLDEVVRWAKQWPTAQVRQISLSTVDGSDENRERRNRLYEQFGIVFEYTPDRRSGVSLSTMVAAQLTPVAPEVWGENIEEWGLVEYLRHGCAQIKDLSYSNNRLERVRRDLVAEIEAARARPLRWACRQLWMRYQFNILVIFFVTCVGVMMWAKLSQ